MKLKIHKQYQEFRNPRVFYPDPKNVDLDRVLIGLFQLLRTNGTRPATTVLLRGAEKIDFHLNKLAEKPGVTGFDREENRKVARAWLESDIFDLVNRNGANPAIASLRPLHLDAFKIKVAKHSRDYNHADALYAMLHFGSPSVRNELKQYLDEGKGAHGDTPLDVETLTVLRMVKDHPDLHATKDVVAKYPPLCIGQARVMCDDIERILTYREVVPRSVMIDYLKTILALHLGIFTMRIGRQITGWLADKACHASCRECPVSGQRAKPFEECPYRISLTVDMGRDPDSRMASLAVSSAATAYEGGLAELVRGLFAMNHLLRYAETKRLSMEPRDVPALLASGDPAFEAHFNVILEGLFKSDGDDAEGESAAPEIEALKDAPLSSFERVVETVTQVRQKSHVTYLWQMLDKLFQKNQPFGSMIAGRTRTQPRRWHLGGRLLEVLVQLAVLRSVGEGAERRFVAEPIRVDELLTWLERRYGFVIAPAEHPDGPRPASIDEHRAFGLNVKAFKERLREIGFYDDLSDAFNAQMVQPRYDVSSAPSETTSEARDGADSSVWESRT